MALRGEWIGGLVAVGCAAVLSACGGSHGHAPAASATSASAPAATNAPAAAASVPGGDWPTFDYTPARTGVGPVHTGITGRNVRSLRLRVVSIDGIVDASAIELHAVKIGRRRRDAIFVTTTYGRPNL